MNKLETPLLPVERMSPPTPSSQKDPRQALIEAGIEIFGKYGYDGAKTRQIAKTAGVNLAAIPYYFGGKEDLYRATIQWIADAIHASAVVTMRKNHDAVDCKTLSPEELVDLAVRHVLTFAVFLEGKNDAAIKLIMSREQILPTAAFSIAHEALGKPLLSMLGEIVALLTETDPDSPEVIIRVQSLMSQATFFAVGRATMLHSLGIEKLDENMVAFTTKIIEQNIRAILMSWIDKH